MLSPVYVSLGSLVLGIIFPFHSLEVKGYLDLDRWGLIVLLSCNLLEASLLKFFKTIFIYHFFYNRGSVVGIKSEKNYIYVVLI